MSDGVVVVTRVMELYMAHGASVREWCLDGGESGVGENSMLLLLIEDAVELSGSARVVWLSDGVTVQPIEPKGVVI